MLRRFNDHGMLLVLLLLCALFSALTIRVEAAEDAAGGRALAQEIIRQHGAGARVLIATRALTVEREFAGGLAEALSQGGLIVARQVAGEPGDARLALQQLAAGGQPLAAIACSSQAAAWLVFADVAADFPALGQPQVMQLRGSRWPVFLGRQNLVNIASQIAVIAIVAIGMTLVIVGGGIDLSVGSLIALAAVLCTLFIRDFAGGREAGPGGMALAAAAAILLCALVGAGSGALITGFNLPPFIVTLAVMLAASGLAYLLAGGQSISQVPTSFEWLDHGASLPGVPNAVALMLLLFGLAHVLMRHTAFGRHLLAVGGNREAALVSGVRVGRVRLITYVVSGALAGLGGVVMASQLRSGSPTYGQMYELYVIAAVVVGGASLSGGRGGMFGTLIGAFIIAVIQNGMNLVNIGSYTQKIVLGLVVLGAVLVDQLRRR